MGDILSNKSSLARVSGAINGAFDGHLGFFLLTIIIAAIIIVFKNFSFKVSN